MVSVFTYIYVVFFNIVGTKIVMHECTSFAYTVLFYVLMRILIQDGVMVNKVVDGVALECADARSAMFTRVACQVFSDSVVLSTLSSVSCPGLPLAAFLSFQYISSE